MPLIVPTTAGLTFANLKDRLYRRGFQYLQTSDADRAGEWINQGQDDLCLEDDWPFLVVTVQDTPPISLGDVREILSVESATTSLVETDRQDLVNADPGLTQTGTANAFWRDGSNLNVYPGDTGTFTVRYLTVPPDMVADTDEPIVPPKWRRLIVEYAVMRALRDRSNFQEAQAVYDALQVDLNRMREALIDLPERQLVT